MFIGGNEDIYDKGFEAGKKESIEEFRKDLMRLYGGSFDKIPALIRELLLKKKESDK